eukprot:173980_1
MGNAAPNVQQGDNFCGMLHEQTREWNNDWSDWKTTTIHKWNAVLTKYQLKLFKKSRDKRPRHIIQLSNGYKMIKGEKFKGHSDIFNAYLFYIHISTILNPENSYTFTWNRSSDRDEWYIQLKTRLDDIESAKTQNAALQKIQSVLKATENTAKTILNQGWMMTALNYDLYWFELIETYLVIYEGKSLDIITQTDMMKVLKVELFQTNEQTFRYCLVLQIDNGTTKYFCSSETNAIRWFRYFNLVISNDHSQKSSAVEMKENVEMNESKLQKMDTSKQEQLFQCTLKIKQQNASCYIQIRPSWHNGKFEELEQYDLTIYNKVRCAYNDKQYVGKFQLISQKNTITFVADSFNDMCKYVNIIRRNQKINEWSCSICTFLNTDRSHCEMCNYVKTEDVKANEIQETETKETETKEVYCKLINLGFEEKIATEAATKYPLQFNKALKFSNIHRINDLKCDTESKNEALCVPVEVTGLSGCIDFEQFVITVDYINSVLICDIIAKCITCVEKYYYPKRYKVYVIKNSFFSDAHLGVKDQSYNIICNKSVTEYSKDEIESKGFRIGVENRFVHKIQNNNITCKYMEDNKTDDPLYCPIYLSMKEAHEYSVDHLSHICEFQHFKDEFTQKVKCRYGDECYSFVRLDKGGATIKDQCHLKIFRHPPRRRLIKLQDNMKQFLVNKNVTHNHGIHIPVGYDEKVFNYNQADGYLNALIFEVIFNGFKSDLCLQTEDIDNDIFSILQIVDQKMKCKRHQMMQSPLNRGEMLAFLLYTGCECNYDLCSSQRNGNYQKWKWFDFCLFNGIQKLSAKETGSY